jgi:hypothetical protein
LKVEADIKVVEADIMALERQETVVHEQLKLMAKGRGLSCWPKPILHPPFLGDVDGFIHNQLRSCTFCKLWYHCFDLVVISCKHTFHPYSLDESLKTSNHCFTCGQILHPDWWTSFGFRGQDDEMQAKALKLKLLTIEKSILSQLEMQQFT